MDKQDVDESVDEPVTTNEASFGFSCKSIWDHIGGICSRPVQLATIAFAAFGASWTLYEATINSLALDPKRAVAYAWLLGVALLISISARIWSYVNTCPDGLEGISPTARRIAHLQRSKWEFNFAKSVLAQLISPIDRQWQAIRRENVYVVATCPRDFRTYFQWLSGRTENMFRMLRVAKKTMLYEFPEALTSTDEKDACPKNILDAVQTITQLYDASVEFEKTSLAIIPPEECEKVHQLQLGWSEPIRDAVHQLFEFLQQICDADPTKETNLDFTITFGEPPNIDEYCEELARVEQKLPQIMEGEW